MKLHLSIIASVSLIARASAFSGVHLNRSPFFSASASVSASLAARASKGRSRSKTSLWGKKNSNKKVDQDNWIDRRVPLDMNDKEEAVRRVVEMEEYDIGISGISFQTGPLSGKMYDAMMSRQDEDLMSNEIKDAYKVYAMDFTAKEATKLALSQNGFESTIEEEDMDDWGIVDSIQFIDRTGRPVGSPYDSWNKAVEMWEPGQGFNFVAREVPAKLREMMLEEVLDALDPDGSLRESAQENGIDLPTEDLQSLRDLANEVARRCEEAPRGSSTAEEAFKGTSNKGYAPIRREALLSANKSADGSENLKTLMHVMNALVVHGCLIVDMGDDAVSLSNMWVATKTFFDALETDSGKEQQLPKMSAIEASPHAKLGYANFQDGMQFMETRLDRETSSVLPNELAAIVGEQGVAELAESFEKIASVGKDVVRVATAASSVENEGFRGISDEAPTISGLPFLADEELGVDKLGNAATEASKCATLMVEELVDDGKLLKDNSGQGPVSMSPHRLCQYSNIKEDAPAEVFGAHIDSSFVTIVPVAAISGLEVFDEEAAAWYRPELKARMTWEAERLENGEDPTAVAQTIEGENGNEIQVPWHARYIVIMPGEFLQIVSRNEIAAAVHRVVASGPARQSAPILLRGRPGVTMDVKRYIGEVNNSLLEQIDGRNMQGIYDALQPSSFQ